MIFTLDTYIKYKISGNTTSKKCQVELNSFIVIVYCISGKKFLGFTYGVTWRHEHKKKV